MASFHKQVTDLERVQKTALKTILKERYKSYDQALQLLKLETLDNRREQLCLNFAKKCRKTEKTRTMFPLNKNTKQNNRKCKEKFVVQHAQTARLMKSSIPQLQRALNQHFS